MADVDQAGRIVFRKVGTLGQDAQRARQRARPEQRALRTAQEFDSLDVI
jgi:hypothetical protein